MLQPKQQKIRPPVLGRPPKQQKIRPPVLGRPPKQQKIRPPVLGNQLLNLQRNRPIIKKREISRWIIAYYHFLPFSSLIL